MVSYPNKSKIGNNNKIANNRGNNYINNVNVGRRNTGLNRPSNLPANKRNWNQNKWGGKNSIWGNGNNVNVNINNNFRNNNNFAYRPNSWGGRPWWGAGNSHKWHHGHWGHGWNSRHYHNHWYYNDNSFAKGFMWGIGVWSLGNMIYDMGYKSYSNPYPAPPVQNTYITYAEPVSVAAAANPPGDAKVSDVADSKSEEALEKSRIAFRQADYMTASQAIDEALGYTPDDVTLHEFRALVFFALGKYSDSTGVLNSVLASGPGWSWDTMIGFYESSSTYSAQLNKLEDYAKGSPEAADARFLLGYHYMVCGELEKSYEEFKVASELQPADTIAPQLRDLTAASIPDNGEAVKEQPQQKAPEPVPVDKLVGTWVSQSANGGTITFTMKETGDYTWDYKDKENESNLTGTYGLNEVGLLVLTSDDSQMVSEVKLADDSKMHFNLIGSPDGEPGLDFKKS